MINIRLLLLMFIMLGLSACGRETLPEGIRLNWMSGGYHDLVVKRNGIDVQVVPADVQWVKAKGSLVYGLIKEYQYTDGVSSKAGYFVLDTQTWKLIDGLAENEVSKYLGTEMQKGS